jgi:CelD/BcsL family acetyltransferase involved in cellulose biosynthesis
MDFLYSDVASVDALARHLATQRLPVLLRRVLADSPAIAAMQDAYRRHGTVHVLPVHPYPYIELDRSWMEPESRFNAGRRSDFRRAQRHAGEFGEVTYEMLSPAPGQVGPLLQQSYEIEMASWKGRTGTALAMDPVRSAFYTRYAMAASECGMLRLARLRINGEGAAMQIAIECGHRFWLLKIGHDDRFAKCSPGTLLMLYAVSHAAVRGLQSFEFLGTVEPWTRAWTATSRPCVSLRAYPRNVGGIAWMTCDMGADRLRTIVRTVAAAIRR